MRRLGKISIINKTASISWDNYCVDMLYLDFSIVSADLWRDYKLGEFEGYVTLKHSFDANNNPRPAKIKKLCEDHSYFDEMAVLNYDQVKNIISKDLAFIRRCRDNENFYVESLPNAFLIKEPGLRKFISDSKRLSICIDLWKSGCFSIQKELLEAARHVLKTDIRVLKDIPVAAYKNNKKFVNSLPIDCRIDCWLRRYNLLKNRSASFGKRRDLLHWLSEEKFPLCIIDNFHLWPMVSTQYKLKLLRELQERIPEKQYVCKVSQALSKLPPEELLFWIKRFPESLFPLLVSHDGPGIGKLSELPPDKLIVWIEHLPAPLAEHLAENQQQILEKIFDIANDLPPNEFLSFAKRLPIILTRHPNVWCKFSAQGQATICDYVWSGSNPWEKLDNKGKIYYMFKMAKEGIPVDTLNGDGIKDEDSPLVCATYLLLKAKNCDSNNKDLLFQRAHKIFESLTRISEQNINKSADMDPLLPDCINKKVLHCEGIIWPNPKLLENWQTTKRVYCPRTRKVQNIYIGHKPYNNIHFPELPLDNSDYIFELISLSLNPHTDCATVRPDTGKPWQDWSLLELLHSSGVVPKITGLKNCYEYISKLAGAFNRIEELRRRLLCRKCGEIMLFDFKYAINFAAYRSTIAHCKHAKNDSTHDKNVYLNHCWACQTIIDSRDNTVQIEGYYLCLTCGSGKQKSHVFRQGDVCPKCGAAHMETNFKDNPHLCMCNKCGHVIELPPAHKMTGNAFGNS